MKCKNCHTILNERSDYCYLCGGKVIRNRLTMRNLFEYFSETFFNYDNTFLKTFIDLLKKPEDVIDGYINGTRKKHVNVLNYFAIAITLSGLQIFFLNKFFPDALDMTLLTPKGSEEFQRQNMSFIQEYQSAIMMLYVPFYALLSKLVFFNKKKYNYTEQLVIFMYIQAEISIGTAVIVTILVLFGMNFGVLSVIMIPTMIVYSGYCLKRLYQLTGLEMAVRTLLFIIVFGVLFILLLIGFLITMHLTGNLETMMGAPRETLKASGN